jgi:hypothetical protein
MTTTVRYVVYLQVFFLCTCSRAPSVATPSVATPNGTSESGSPKGCSAPAEWFGPSGAPESNNDKISDSGDECAFYKWAYQTFLHEAQWGDAKRPRFLEYPGPDRVFFRQGEPSAATLRFPDASDSRISLAPRVALSSDVATSLDEVTQADAGLLIDSNHRAIYYGVHLNGKYVDFIAHNKLQDPRKLAGPELSLIPFPIGTLELKSSWKILGPNDASDTYITTTARISLLKNVGGHPKIDRKAPPKEVVVGLVGLHVVGVIDGHPEFIWSTFEHKDNAPNLRIPPAFAKGDYPVDFERDYTFYPKRTPVASCNVKFPPAQKLDPMTQLFLETTPVYREYAHGGEPHPEDQINPLNESVLHQLAPTSKLRNYELVGAVWLRSIDDFKVGRDFGKESPESLEKLFAGEVKLANSTIETFSQSDNIEDGRAGCFHCHGTDKKAKLGIEYPANLIGVSRVLVNAYVNDRLTHP